MTKRERVHFVIETLNRLYPETHTLIIPIPTLLIAVLLSAQSTDVRVNQITPYCLKKPVLLSK